jgi:LAGLIDADG-like domain
MESRDKACLYKLKQRYGGYIKATSHANAMRFRLHNKNGILQVLNDLNGLILNPIRIEQVKKVCFLYNINFKTSEPLYYESAYLSGLIDSDGSIYYNKSSQQVFITVSQKNPFLLDLLVSVYGGKVYPINANKTAFK